MRAIVQTRYGTPDDLVLRELDPPVPAEDEVLVSVRAASLHPDVWHVMSGRPYALRLMGAGVRRPKDVVPGTDVAGVVDAVGASVTRFRPGDEVYGETIRAMQWRNGGACAEYATAPEHGLARKPATVSFEEAATVPTAGLIALHNLPRTGARAGQRVLVNGAGGGVGAFALQLVKAYGAHVTAVEHPSKEALVRSLGADRFLDYTQQDFTALDERWDLVFDVPGNQPWSRIKHVVAPGGRYVLIGHDGFGAGAGRWLGSIPRVLGLTARSVASPRLRGAGFSSPDKQESMTVLTDLLAAGRLTPVIDRAYPLAEMPEAMRYLMSGQAVGRVVITV